MKANTFHEVFDFIFFGLLFKNSIGKLIRIAYNQSSCLVQNENGAISDFSTVKISIKYIIILKEKKPIKNEEQFPLNLLQKNKGFIEKDPNIQSFIEKMISSTIDPVKSTKYKSLIHYLKDEKSYSD